jgi:transposase
VAGDAVQIGTFEKSRVIPRDLDEIRDYSRLREQARKDCTATKNRAHKLIEKGGFHVSQVVSDLFGVSGTIIINGLLEQKSPESILAEVRSIVGYRLKTDDATLISALQGTMSKVLRTQVKMLLETVAHHEKQIKKYDRLLEEELIEMGQENNLDLLQTIPGVSEKAGRTILVELGCDLTDFRSAKALSGRAGMCPGNNESVGKKKSGKTNQGNRHIRRILCEVAASAVKSESYYKLRFKSLIPRLRYKKAIVAIGNQILKAIWHMLMKQEPYKDIGKDIETLMKSKNPPRWVKKQLAYELNRINRVNKTKNH